MERSFLVQSLHYFGRPHSDIPVDPVISVADWRAKELDARRDEWMYILSDAEIEELKRAVNYVMSRNISLDNMKKSDFKIPLLEPSIQKWSIALDPSRGIGVTVIKRVPVHLWSVVESSTFWWGLGLHLGFPGAQNGRGDLIGHVKDEGFFEMSGSGGGNSFGKVRQYRTNERIEFHCDVADVVGLLCLQTAKIGGRSRLASSVAVFNELQKTKPLSIPRLFSSLPLDSRGDGGFNYVFVTPCRFFEGILRTFWHTEYFQSAYRYEDSVVPSIPHDVREIVSAYDDIANSAEFAFEMEFEQGDVQLISNHVVVHSRTKFENNIESSEVRHLLRLWLSLPSGP
ncbi:unnamed protein product, partial [Ectocarpus fasciculatus]